MAPPKSTITRGHPPSVEKLRPHLPPELGRGRYLDMSKAMENPEASSYLSQFIGKPLRIHTSDGRVFGGQMKCTDKDRNIILALTYEYRSPSAEAIRKAVEASGNPSAPVNWNSRYVGLVVIPGEHVKKIEFEETAFPGQKSNIAL